MIKADILRRMLDRGFAVSVIKTTGIVEKFHPLRNGNVAITYSGVGVCMSCGRMSRGNCSCSGELETVTMTGCFRHINSLIQSIGEVELNSDEKTIKVTEVQP